MLRLLVNKARHHYNDALEHAERGRTTEAIDELHNALDLDRSFAAAHVVLGTLFAKQGEYEKAKESWNAALAIQPEYGKAHEYLQRVEAAESSLPALRLYRWIALLSFLIMLGLAGWWIYNLRPDPNVERLQSALELYEQGVYGKALRELETVRRQSDPKSPSNVAAASLRHALQADLRQQVRRIQDLKYRDQYDQALMAINDLERRQPDNATSAALAAIRQDIVHYYQEEIEKLYNDVENDLADFELLASHVNRFLELYPDAPEREEIRSYLTRGREKEAARAIDELRQEFARDHEYVRAREKLADLMTLYPGSDALAGGRTDLVDEILIWMFQEFTRLLDDRRYQDAELLLADIEDSAPEFRDVADVTGHVALARRVLDDSRRSSLLRDAEALVKNGDHEAAQEALFYLSMEPALTEAELDLMADLQSQIQTEQTRVPLPELTKAEQERYFALKIEDEEASRSLANLDDWLQRVPNKQGRVALLARATAAAVKLQDRDAATSLTARLREEGAPASLVRQVPKLPEPKKEPEETPVPRTIIEPVEPEEPTPAPTRNTRRRSR